MNTVYTVKYFYSEIQKPADSVFYQEAGGFGSGKYKMRPGWQLHLYISQLPCGDASLNSQLLPCLNSSSKEGFAISSTTKLNDMMEEFLESSMKNNGDCSHVIGTVQRKPGRGDATLSVSCSDKISRWNVVGVQGLIISIDIGTYRKHGVEIQSLSCECSDKIFALNVVVAPWGALLFSLLLQAVYISSTHCRAIEENVGVILVTCSLYLIKTLVDDLQLINSPFNILLQEKAEEYNSALKIFRRSHTAILKIATAREGQLTVSYEPPVFVGLWS
ncbi:adenosine deaminase/editase [Tanacetum coccineum]|uniref:Adenosine deaminase/editase n=1 Tax=Tanacetum coccineum TaxID=301880 RepID=A0ABQ5D665_9ASTR